MQVTRNTSDGSMLLTYDGTLWSKWLLGVAAIFVATAIYDVTIGARGDDRLIALAGGVLTCVSGALLMYERARWRFDPFDQTIEWNRRWAFQHKSGTLRFAEVRSVLIDVPIGDEGVPSRRIVMQMVDGSTIPVTVGYRPDHGDVMSNVAAELREMLKAANERHAVS